MGLFLNGSQSIKEDKINENDLYENVTRCLLNGLFDKIAYYDDNSKKYKTYSNEQLVDIHPSSMLFRKRPQCILYSSMIKTKNVIWCRHCTQIINEDWLDSIIPNLKLLSNTVNNVKKIKKTQPQSIEKPKHGKAVKRMHSLFHNVQNKKFDFKEQRKKNKKNHKMQSSAGYNFRDNQRNYYHQHLQQRNNYKNNKKRKKNQYHNRRR